jgi:hypothetical protein
VGLNKQNEDIKRTKTEMERIQKKLTRTEEENSQNVEESKEQFLKQEDKIRELLNKLEVTEKSHKEKFEELEKENEGKFKKLKKDQYYHDFKFQEIKIEERYNEKKYDACCLYLYFAIEDWLRIFRIDNSTHYVFALSLNLLKLKKCLPELLGQFNFSMDNEYLNYLKNSIEQIHGINENKEMKESNI